MKFNYTKKSLLIIVLLLNGLTFSYAQTATKSAQIEQKNVEASMEFLAGDALQGRGSGTQFEWIAATYFASMMKQFGIMPAGEKDVSDKQNYIQTVNIVRNSFAEPPKMTYQNVSLEHGKEILVFSMNSGKISGGLQKISLDDQPKNGAINFVRLREGEDAQKLSQNFGKLLNSNAVAIIIEETSQSRSNWERSALRLPSFTTISSKTPNSPALIILSKDSADALAKIEDGTNIEISGKLNEPEIKNTWNAVGKIEGSDPKLASEVILLSAHLDHLGVRENAPSDDKIFNGADDDASGCVAVLELARVISQGKRPKRSVYFVVFGSEEAGGFGANYFVNNLPFPKENLVANLEFEMIGRPDVKVAADELWLTGYDRSNLGAELAKRGAKLVNNPHPEQNFFQRSDNYTLARQGIIAHTVSSFGLHTDYHHAGDELKTIDFEHMTRAINSMIKPIEWLINSDFKPSWYEGKKP
ncbi:MAG: M20/M25/M40 family metallo-hydrolase [Aridibacter sp.]